MPERGGRVMTLGGPGDAVGGERTRRGQGENRPLASSHGGSPSVARFLGIGEVC
jgi:hypothetical protein